MQKKISLLLIMVMIVTMMTPIQLASYAVDLPHLFFTLDSNVVSSEAYKDYSVAMSITVNGTQMASRTAPPRFLNYYLSTTYNVSDTVALTVNIDNADDSLQYSQTFTIDAGDDLSKLTTVNFDPTQTGAEISINTQTLTVNTRFLHSEPSYKIYYQFDNGSLTKTNKAVLPGSYKVHYINETVVDTKKTQNFINADYTIDEASGDIVADMAPETAVFDMSGTLGIDPSYYTVSQSVFYDKLFLATLNGIDQVTLNPSGYKHVLWLDGGSKHYYFDIPFETRVASLDLSKIIGTATSTTGFQNEIILDSAFSFTDKNGNPLTFENLSNGTYEIVSQAGSISGGISNQMIDLGGLSGAATLKINIPDFGIVDLVRDINIQSSTGQPVGTFDDYAFEIVDVATNEAQKGVYTDYDASKNQIYIYVPENSKSILTIKGINDGQTEVDPIALNLSNTSEHPQYTLDNATGVLELGSVQGGYSDWLFGNLANNTNVQIVVYSGMLGVLTLENVNSTEENKVYFEGEVEYHNGYKFSNSDGSGSMSNTQVLNGKMFIPIQTEMLGVDYFYLVISPTKGNSTVPQANTEFLELSSKFNNSVNGLIDLGTAKFQTPTMSGEVFKKDETPASSIKPYANINYIGTEMDLAGVYFTMGTWENSTGQTNMFYLAPLGSGFSTDANLDIKSFDGSMKPITATAHINSGENQYKEVKDQLIIKMLNPEGEQLIEGSGLDRSIFLIQGYDSKSVYWGNKSTAAVAGMTEGETYTLLLSPDSGDLDHLRYWTSKKLTFTYTNLPGTYTATNSVGEEVSYTVDAEGIVHIDLKVDYAQVYGQVFADGKPYEGAFIQVEVVDLATNQVVARDNTHTSGGYNSQPLKFGVINIGSDLKLQGDYKIVISDPIDSVYYTGITKIVNFPITEPINIQLPKSKVFGKIVLSDSDNLAFKDNISRVFVNVFDATGKFVRNALVRRDGVFSVGELKDGKYFAKIFVSPFSSLASLYTTSKMNVFSVDNSSDSVVEFIAPLESVIGSGQVLTPNDDVVSETWVRIYDGLGREVEAVKTNDQGQFKLPKMSNGNYTLKALGNGVYEDSLSTPFSVVNQMVEGEQRVRLTEKMIDGDVVNAAGQRISGTQVLLFDSSKKLISIENSVDGTYDFGGVVAGNYYLQVRCVENDLYVDSEFIPVSYSGQLKTTTIQLEEAFYRGSVLNPNGTKAMSGWVHVYKENAYLKSVPVNADGTFKIEAFENPALITLVAEDNTGHYMPSPSKEIGLSNMPELTLRDNIGYTTSLRYQGQLLANTMYYLYDANGKPLYQTQTNSFGELFISELPTGNYKVVVPYENSYLIGDIAFASEGQHVEFTDLIKGE